jgi:hypothetical protein
VQKENAVTTSNTITMTKLALQCLYHTFISRSDRIIRLDAIGVNAGNRIDLRWGAVDRERYSHPFQHSKVEEEK